MELPNTDSPEVMELAVAVFITEQLWTSVGRMTASDETEQVYLALYDRVYKALKKTHGAKG
jgi:hypothetical protein